MMTETSFDLTSIQTLGATQRVLSHRFQLQDIIGSGGMGVVYRAVDGATGQAVAIKMLNYDMSVLPEAQAALAREAEKEQLCNHPNLIKTYGYYRDGAVGYKVMELLDGVSLKSVIQQKNVQSPALKAQSVPATLILALQMLQGLEAMHNKGLVHSDLKPSNVMVLANQQLKVFDFGIVRSIHEPQGLQLGEALSQFDPASLMAFTPVYASYEMLTRQPASASDDVFASACIIYEMLTGEHPYRRVSAEQAVMQRLVCSKPPYLSSRLWSALIPALALQQADRYARADDFAMALQQTQTRGRWWKQWLPKLTR